MSKKAWWLISFILMIIFCSSYAEEEAVIINPNITGKVANPTDEPIISGSMNPMVGEEYTYTLVNANKATNIVIKIFPATYTSSGSYSYYPNNYISRTLSSSGTFQYTFTELRPYLLTITYTKSGENKSITFFIDTVNKTAELGKKISRIVQECRQAGATSQYEIALWLHDYLIYHAHYDLTYTEYGPDGVLLKGYGVCDSYSRAYQMLLDAFGIPNHRQSGTAGGGSHAWNVVQLNGKWYNVDVTWDDPAGDDILISGSEGHEYFAIPDSILGIDHTYDITYPCTSADGSYYIIHGLPDHAAYYVENNIISSGEIGNNTIAVAADCYCTKYREDEDGTTWTSSSSKQNEIVFPLMLEYLSNQWWLGEDGNTIYQYSFTYNPQSQQLIGTKAATSQYTAVCTWDHFPLIQNQMAVRYKFNKPINHTQGLWLWFQISTPNSSSYQSVRVKNQEGTAIVEYDSLDPFDVTVILENQELAKLHAIPFSPNDGQLLLPNGLKILGEEAFWGTAERFVKVPSGCTAILQRAFANSAITCILIPSSVHQIAENTFENCSSENLWIIVEEGSYADSWADNRFHHMSIDGKVLD